MLSKADYGLPVLTLYQSACKIYGPRTGANLCKGINVVLQNLRLILRGLLVTV